MTVRVRDFRPGDAEAVTWVERGAVPFLVATAQSVLWKVETAPAEQHFRQFVAELDGRVVGEADAGLAYDSSTPGQAFTNPKVHPDHRGRGAGTALLAAAEEHLGAHGAATVYAWAYDTEQDLAFAAGRGYRQARSGRFLHLDLAHADLSAPPPLPAGAELRTFADFAADPRPLFEADAEATADEPSDTPADVMEYDQWLSHTWREPLLDHELTSVVVVDGEVAAYSLADTDGRTRYSSGMTGCRRAYRGRGLARLAKHDSLRRAQAAGYTDAYTGNDAGNAPMLAINERLGYAPAGAEWRCVKELARSAR